MVTEEQVHVYVDSHGLSPLAAKILAVNDVISICPDVDKIKIRFQYLKY